ncbi:MAG: hypothetical protein ACP5RD_08075, partial [bacterium]
MIDMVDLKKYSYVINSDIIKKIEKYIKEKDTLNFEDVNVLEYTHQELAKLIIKYDLSVVNLKTKDLDKVKYYMRLEFEPQIDDIDKFKQLFKKRFHVGDVAILEEIGDIHIIYIENIYDNYIRIRKYY